MSSAKLSSGRQSASRRHTNLREHHPRTLHVTGEVAKYQLARPSRAAFPIRTVGYCPQWVIYPSLEVCMTAKPPDKVVHFLSGVAIGGKEAAALRSARRAVHENKPHRLLLFETSFRSTQLDFDPVNVPLDFIPRRGGFDLKFALALRSYLDILQPGVVHAYNDTAIFYAAFARFWGHGTYKIVGTFHTWPSHPTRGARLASGWACRHADAIVAVSDELRSRLVTSGWADRCVVIPNGVDLTQFKPGGTRGEWRRQL